jgi:hypothetical protein
VTGIAMGPTAADHTGGTPTIILRTGDPVDVAGAWFPVEHIDGTGCAAEPRRHSLATALPAPACPHCDGEVRWQLVEVPGPAGEVERV